MVDDRARRGKTTVKKIISVLNLIADQAGNKSISSQTVLKALPIIENHTTRQAMEKLKSYTSQQTEMYLALKTELTEGPITEINSFLVNYRIEYTELEELAKDSNKIYHTLQKNVKDLKKKSEKATEEVESIKQDIEDGRKSLTIQSPTLTSSKSPSTNVPNSTTNGKNSPTKHKSAKGGHSRNKSTGGSWSSFKNVFSKRRASQAALELTKKMEKKIIKMEKRGSSFSSKANAAEIALKKATDEFEKGETLVSNSSSERERAIAYMESTVVYISIPPPSFKPVSLSLSRSLLF